MHSVMYRLQVLWLNATRQLRKTYIANACGHQTKKTGEVRANGARYILSLPLWKNGNPDYCIDCIANMSIKCAWCSHPIRVGDPITLYSPGPRMDFISSEEPSEVQRVRAQDDFVVPDHAVVYCDDPLMLVGCLRWDCADSGMDRQGFWFAPGKVHRVLSPIEMLLAGGGDSRAVVVGDLSDPTNIGKVF